MPEDLGGKTRSGPAGQTGEGEAPAEPHAERHAANGSAGGGREAVGPGPGAPSHLCQLPAPPAPPERYELTWVGKRNALRVLETPIRAVLIPAPEESLHFETTQHHLIEGENLEALKLLAAPYRAQVKMIYIDPPYNTGNDFLYPDDFSAPLETYLRLTGQKDGHGRRAHGRPETNGRYHAAWLSMIYPRLLLARDLLRPDGFMAVSIGEEEMANLRLLMNEIFGEENYRNTILVRRYDKNLNRQFIGRGLLTLNVGAEYALLYARGPAATLNPVYRPASPERQRRGYWKGFWNAADRPTMRYDILGVTPRAGQWKWKQDVAIEAVRNYQVYAARFAATMTLEAYWEHTGQTKRFIRRNPAGRGKNQGVEHWIPSSAGILRTSNWTDLLASAPPPGLSVAFDSPKNVAFLKELLRLCTATDSLVLDFFAGSGTTAQAVLELNREDAGRRRFLLVQLPEPTANPHLPTICAIAKERLRQVIARLERDRRSQEDLGFKIFKLIEAGS